MPHIRIYVNEFALANAVEDSSFPNTLARAMLDVLFTKEALRICSATKKDGALEERRMLHQDGMNAIYRFVKTHTKEETGWLGRGKWTSLTTRSMKRSVCQKLNELKQVEKLNTGRKEKFYRG